MYECVRVRAYACTCVCVRVYTRTATYVRHVCVCVCVCETCKRKRNKATLSWLRLVCCRHEVPVTSEPITVIHMDEDVVVVNKPASIPVSGVLPELYCQKKLFVVLSNEHETTYTHAYIHTHTHTQTNIHTCTHVLSCMFLDSFHRNPNRLILETHPVVSAHLKNPRSRLYRVYVTTFTENYSWSTFPAGLKSHRR